VISHCVQAQMTPADPQDCPSPKVTSIIIAGDRSALLGVIDLVGIGRTRAGGDAGAPRAAT